MARWFARWLTIARERWCVWSTLLRWCLSLALLAWGRRIERPWRSRRCPIMQSILVCKPCERHTCIVNWSIELCRDRPVSLLHHWGAYFLLNFTHNLGDIHSWVDLTVLTIFTLQVLRIQVKAFFGGFHWIVLHALFKLISSFLLVRLRVKIRLDHVVMRYGELSLLKARPYFSLRHLSWHVCWRLLRGHAPLLDRLHA